MFKKFYRPLECPEAFGIPVSTLAKLRMKGVGPLYVKRGRSIIYYAQDVLDWMESNKVLSTAEGHQRRERS